MEGDIVSLTTEEHGVVAGTIGAVAGCLVDQPKVSRKRIVANGVIAIGAVYGLTPGIAEIFHIESHAIYGTLAFVVGLCGIALVTGIMNTFNITGIERIIATYLGVAKAAQLNPPEKDSK